MTICISETESWGGGSGEKGHLYFMDRTGVQNGNFERRGGGEGATKCTIGEGNRRKETFKLHEYRGTKAIFEGGGEHWGTRKT